MLITVSIYSKHAGFDLRLLNRTDCYVWLYQKKLWLFMFEMHLTSGITDGWQGCEPPSPAKLNGKTRPLPSGYIGIYYSFGFSRLLFFLRFLEYFPVISGFCIAIKNWKRRPCVLLNISIVAISVGLPVAINNPVPASQVGFQQFRAI